MIKVWHNTKQKLVDVKISLKLIASDYDGTLVDSSNTFYNHQRAKEIIFNILKKYHCVIITARGASALKVIVPQLLRHAPFSHRLFFGGANGILLYELDSNGIKKIYDHSLSFAETKYLLNIYQKTCQSLEIQDSLLNQQGVKNFLKFLSWDWTGIISSKTFQLNKLFEGKVFIEDAKISLVLPKYKKYRRLLLNNLQKNIGGGYTVVVGDEIYAHITKKLPKDGKLTVVNNLIEMLNLNITNIAAFGDMPKGNDRSLLTLPFAFTNDHKFIKTKSDHNKPPYILPYTPYSPVESVHRAISYLCT